MPEQGITIIERELNVPMRQWTWEELVSAGIEAREMKDHSQRVLGKLALTVVKNYGEDSLGKFAYAIGFKRDTLKVYRWVEKAWESDFPQTHLPYTAYQILATLENKRELLKEAADNNWPLEKLSMHVKNLRAHQAEVIELETHQSGLNCPRCGFFIDTAYRTVEPFTKKTAWLDKKTKTPLTITP